MNEITSHKIYELLNTKYTKLELDYVILDVRNDYNGLDTHKKAIIEFFKILNERYELLDDQCFSIEVEKMKAEKISIENFLQLPTDNYCETRNKKERSYDIPNPITYWYAFLESPHGTSYNIGDFIKFNDILFPNKLYLDVYCWNDNFSNYFDAGKEWWGTGLWSIYDKSTGIMVIIGASTTD